MSAIRDWSRRAESGATITEPLLDLHLAGDSAATRRLIGRLERPLRAAVRFHPVFSGLRGRVTEDDVLGELWRAVLQRRSLEGFSDRGRGSLRAYLRGALDRALRDLARRASAERRGGGMQPYALDDSRGPGALASRLADDAAGPSAVALRDELAERCRRALPRRDAEVFRMRVEEGRSFEEIASRLDGTPAAARGIFHRARQRLVQQGVLELPDARS